MVHNPTSVSISNRVRAQSETNLLNIVKHKTIFEVKSFEDLLQVGTPNQILKFMEEKNFLTESKKFDFSKITYLCKDDKKFWLRLMEILRQKHFYEKEVWKFAFMYKEDDEAISDLICNEGYNLLSHLPPHFESKLVSNLAAEPATPYFFNKMLEYNPMINSRVHKVGADKSQQILNKTFRETYFQFLQTTAMKGELVYEDKMTFVYYLQL